MPTSTWPAKSFPLRHEKLDRAAAWIRWRLIALDIGFTPPVGYSTSLKKPNSLNWITEITMMMRPMTTPNTPA